MHSVTGILYYNGILSIWPIAKYTERRKGCSANSHCFMGQTNSARNAIFTFAQNYTSRSEESKVSVIIFELCGQTVNVFVFASFPIAY